MSQGGRGIPGWFSSKGMHIPPPDGMGRSGATPLTEDPLAPFGPGGPCGERGRASAGGRSLPLPAPACSSRPPCARVPPPRVYACTCLTGEVGGGRRSPTRRPGGSRVPRVSLPPAPAGKSQLRQPEALTRSRSSPRSSPQQGPASDQTGPPWATCTRAQVGLRG